MIAKRFFTRIFLETPPLYNDDNLVNRSCPKFKIAEEGKKVQFQIGLQFISMKLAKQGMKEFTGT